MSDDIDNLEQATSDLEVILENWYSLSDRTKRIVVEHVKDEIQMVKRDMEFEREEKMAEGYEKVGIGDHKAIDLADWGEIFGDDNDE